MGGILNIYIYCVNIYVFQFFWYIEESRWIKISFDEIRKFELYSDNMKITKKKIFDIWKKMWNKIIRTKMRWILTWNAKQKYGIWDKKNII